MTPDRTWVLGLVITLVALVLRWHGQSWGRVIGTMIVLVSAAGLAVLLLVVGLHLFS
jgi:hypothetical protein